MRIVCSGGGTGGHIFPAIAVAQEVKKRKPEAVVLFIGAKGRMEMTKVPKAGFPIKGLWISGFQRQLTLRNALFPIKLIWSIVGAYCILKKFRPDVVIGFGGYASGAALWVASKMGIPTLIQEQNCYAGMTNKILDGKVDIVCLAYEEASIFFSKSKTVITGNPIREDLVARKDKKSCRKILGLNQDKRTILVIGGSLGAKSINDAIVGSFSELKNLENIQILWQCGSNYFEKLKISEVTELKHVHLMPFIEDMAAAYGAANIVVCRAGALTIAEVMHLGMATILVPSPNVAEDHQTKNAMALVDRKAAILLKDSELEKLIGTIKSTLNDSNLLEDLQRNIKALDRPDAVEHIVDEVEKLISNSRN